MAWPLAAQAQQPALPVIGLVAGGLADASAGYAAAFRKGLGETGYVEGQNVTVEKASGRRCESSCRHSNASACAGSKLLGRRFDPNLRSDHGDR
jgi:hypothetical protein